MQWLLVGLSRCRAEVRVYEHVGLNCYFINTLITTVLVCIIMCL